MDQRRRLCSRVLEGGWTVTAASLEAGVSRQTGSLWVSRARASGLAGMSELSRRPACSPKRTCAQVEQRLLEFAREHPYWGPKKILRLAYPSDPPVCERTAARILSRNGLRVQGGPGVRAEAVRFEREESNELWQIDFKVLGPRKGRVQVLSVLDDASRFLLGLRPCPDQTLESVKETLWAAFGEYGLPACVLSDNGAAFRNNATWRWSSLDLWLMLLGVRSIHGRPRHPQTQGKVERLHGTLERERVAPDGLEEFRARYNWVRPHEALGMRTPGQSYAPSPRPRPGRPPEPWFPQDAALRKADGQGKFRYKGRLYRAGTAFGDGHVGIVETEQGAFLCWAGNLLSPLDDLLLP